MADSLREAAEAACERLKDHRKTGASIARYAYRESPYCTTKGGMDDLRRVQDENTVRRWAEQALSAPDPVAEARYIIRELLGQHELGRIDGLTITQAQEWLRRNGD